MITILGIMRWAIVLLLWVLVFMFPSVITVVCAICSTAVTLATPTGR